MGSVGENRVRLNLLEEKYPKNLKVLRNEQMVDLLDMDGVVKTGTSGMSTFENNDSAGADFISRQLSSGKDVAILAAGSDKYIVFTANGLFKKGW